MKPRGSVYIRNMYEVTASAEQIGYLVLENRAVLLQRSSRKITKCRKIKIIEITLNSPFKINKNYKNFCINLSCVYSTHIQI